MEEINTANDFWFGVIGFDNNFRINPMLPVQDMDRDKALRAAAWLVAMADPMQDKFPQVLEAVLNT